MPGSSVENQRPALSVSDVEIVLCDQFNIAKECVGTVKQLDSYDDQNFYIKLKPDGREVLLKITNWKDSENTQLISEMTEMMWKLGESGVPCSVPHRTRLGSLLGEFRYADGANNNRRCVARLFDFLPGNVLKAGSLTREQAFQWGDLLARLHRALQDMTFPNINARKFLWSWEGVPEVMQYVNVIENDSDRQLVSQVFEEYTRDLVPRMKQIKRELLHGDLNERNVLVNAQGEVFAVLDFGDCHGGPLLWDVSLVLMYACIVLPDVHRDLVDCLGQALAGYAQSMAHVLNDQQQQPFDDLIDTVRLLVCTRLCQSLTLGLRSFASTGDPYVLTTQKQGWTALRKLRCDPRENFAQVWTPLLKRYGVHKV